MKTWLYGPLTLFFIPILMIHPVRTAASIASLLALCIPRSSFAQATPDPWTPEQLMEPAVLAHAIADSTVKAPVIFDIGPAGNIPGAIAIGPGEDEVSMTRLRAQLADLPKDAEVVIYCGCCPFDRCPNVRPAFNVLKELGFVNGRLLDLPHDLKQDWIDKCYPIAP